MNILTKTLIIGTLAFGIPISLAIIFKTILSAILPLTIASIILVSFIYWLKKSK